MPSASQSSPKARSRFSSLDKKESKLFAAFCKRAAAEENLHFLALVRKFKKANAAGRVKYYHKIHVNHLDVTTSVEPINLDCSMIRDITNSAEGLLASHVKLPRTLFDEAEQFITEIVDMDLLPKFQTRARSNSTWC